jgi:phage terminase large subunit-like protein
MSPMSPKDAAEFLKPMVRPMGKYEKLAYARAANDRKLCELPGGHPKGFYFDTAEADRCVQFVERFCKHHKGEWAGQPLLLQEWQKFCIRETYGWRRADGTRRFRISYREVARKNGKTEQAAAEGNLLTIADRENGAEVYATATKEDQAKIVWLTAREQVRQSPELRQWVRPRQKALICERLTSIFRPLGADSSTLDGLNPHGHICDEMHAHKKRGVWDVMITGMGARRQPLTIVITTAGVYDPESIGWELHTHAQQVLDGVVEDDTFFCIIFAADEGDDWKDPATWYKANPNLGISVKYDYLAEQCERAKKTPSSLNPFLRLHLNIWTQQVTRWIPIDAWNLCASFVDRNLEAHKGRIGYGGLDLSTKLDITSLCITLPAPGEMYDMLWWFWVPEELVRERARTGKRPDYDAWVRDGWLITTPGNVVDYGFIRKQINDIRKIIKIRQLGFDPWNATQLANDLVSDGFSTDSDAKKEQLIEMRQGMKTLSEPSKKFEALIMDGKIRHGGNPIMQWMIDNMAIRRDANDNIAPDKKSAAGKIDGGVAAIMSLGRAILDPQPRQSVYETRGVRSF